MARARKLFDEDRAIALYRDGCPAQEICDLVGVSAKQLYLMFERRGVALKKPQHRRGKALKPRPQPVVLAEPSQGGPRYVERDPCFWCGTRGDLPCRHNGIGSRQSGLGPRADGGTNAAAGRGVMPPALAGSGEVVPALRLVHSAKPGGMAAPADISPGVPSAERRTAATSA